MSKKLNRLIEDYINETFGECDILEVETKECEFIVLTTNGYFRIPNTNILNYITQDE